MFGKFISNLVNIGSYESRSNRYRSIVSCVIGTLNFLARKKRNKKLESKVRVCVSDVTSVNLSRNMKKKQLQQLDKILHV